MPNHPDLTGAQLHPPGDHAASHAPGGSDPLDSDYAEAGHDHAGVYSPVAHDHNSAYAAISVKSPMYSKLGASAVFVAYANGDPGPLFPNNLGSATPDNISTASFNRARGVLFRLPRTLAVTDAYIPGNSTGSSGGMYKVCVYKASDNSQVWASSAFDTVSNDWANISGLSFTLNADTDYYLFTITTASSAASTARIVPNPTAVSFFNSNSPFFTPTGQGYHNYKEYTAAVAGTLDSTMPALTVQSGTAGSCMCVLFKGTAT